jgi:hypothetical protein
LSDEKGTVFGCKRMFKSSVMVRFFVLWLCLSVPLGALYAQSDSTIFEAPSPFAPCEREAVRISQEITRFNISQRDSLAALLVSWEHQCGTGETSARLDLLIAIAEKQLQPQAVEAYYDRHLGKFYDRRNFGRYDNQLEYYEKHKGYWEFIPLNGRFDRWTAATAKALLDSQPMGSDARLLCLLFSGDYSDFAQKRSSWAYRESHTSQYFKDKYGLIYGWEIETTVLFGSWLPQGRMADIYHPSPQLGFQLSLPIVGETRGHLGAGFTILQQKQAVRILTEDTVVDAKTRVGFQLGAGISQRFRLAEKWHLDLGGDLAFNALTTNQKRPVTDPEYDGGNYGINAVDLGLTAGLERRLGERKSLGLSASWHYVPYGFDRKLLTPLGNSYAVVGLKMRFW